ncbi:esterase/lipase family protein [Aspergillus ruber CBS 135680]|uniref:AB hydrolase-1 domain-containing protein n=1 Tax=Aspergillus ruber (strain CBS 135680) TaxID=1388766 RepID=A0A017SEL1_ASPRC|nr:uncharacterized protein EURHEDRAFT_515316 [Aspergillus ruber CBS 135680]EYE95458.1 hypothetical protein EURHEDRAFT_515316 [Aspergillus ruber CBS 135680]
MNKTILIVLIHGFKGDDATFGEFPEHLRALIRRKLPAIKVVTIVYPKYETRGDLRESVNRFREWLQDKVIDLEVANRTASPTVDPSVHVFLVGHSMGGIVAADTLLLLASERPLTPEEPLDDDDDASSQISANSHDSTVAHCPRLVEPSDYMFPHVQGVIAFDTPYLGIAPGVVSYNAEGHYKTATSAYNAISEVAGFFGWGKSNNDTAASQQKEAVTTTVTQTSTGQTSHATDAAATPSWQRWGRYAMFAGAAGAVAAGGAAAMYTQRDRLTDGWGWVSSHLSFVGCLARPAVLRRRLARLSKVRRERNIGCTNFYTALGQGADPLVETTNEGQTQVGQKIIRSKNRTFCTLPTEEEEAELGLGWVKAQNDQVKNELSAHVSMFSQKANPAFQKLVDHAGKLLVKSIDKDWYASARGSIEGINEGSSRLRLEDSGRRRYEGSGRPRFEDGGRSRHEGSSRSSRHESSHSSRSSHHGSSRSSRSSRHGSSSHVTRVSRPGNRRRDTDSPFMSGDDVVMIN